MAAKKKTGRKKVAKKKTVKRRVAEKAVKKKAARKPAAKLGLINTGTNKLNGRRNAPGTSFTEGEDVGRSLAANRRRKAKSVVKGTAATGGAEMKVAKFSLADAALERSPGQDADIFAGNVIDQRHGGPITIGYGRYGPNQTLDETMAVDDVMMVLEGRVSVTSHASAGAVTVSAGPGEFIYMPKGEKVTIRSHEQGAVTAYVTYPHWQEAHA